MENIKDYIELLPDNEDEVLEILSGNSVETIKGIRETITQGVEFSPEDYEEFLCMMPYKQCIVLRSCDKIIKANTKTI